MRKSVRSDYKMSATRKRSDTVIDVISNISILVYIFFNFLVGNNHMNLCTKYNVYIIFLI